MYKQMKTIAQKLGSTWGQFSTTSKGLTVLVATLVIGFFLGSFTSAVAIEVNQVPVKSHVTLSDMSPSSLAWVNHNLDQEITAKNIDSDKLTALAQIKSNIESARSLIRDSMDANRLDQVTAIQIHETDLRITAAMNSQKIDYGAVEKLTEAKQALAKAAANHSLAKTSAW